MTEKGVFLQHFRNKSTAILTITQQILRDFKAGIIQPLYAEGYSSLLAYASRRLEAHYAMMAEDCVQDAIMKAYGTRHTFTAPFQLKSFLFTCIHNATLSILRKADSQANYLSAQTEGYEQELTASIIEQEPLDLLHQAIRELPDKYREVFDLSYEQGLKNQEIATQLGLTVEAIHKRKARLISLLREKLKNSEQLLVLLTIT